MKSRSSLIAFFAAAAAALCLAITPAASADGPKPVKVMTWNLFYGFDDGPVIAAAMSGDEAAIAEAATVAWGQIHATNFHRRVRDIALRIRLEEPDLIGVQEAVRYVQIRRQRFRHGDARPPRDPRRGAAGRRAAVRGRVVRGHAVHAAAGHRRRRKSHDGLRAGSRRGPRALEPRKGRGVEPAERHLPGHPRAGSRLPVPASAGLGFRRRQCLGPSLPLRHDAPRRRVRGSRGPADPGSAGGRAREPSRRRRPPRRLRRRLQHGRLPQVAHVQAPDQPAPPDGCVEGREPQRARPHVGPVAGPAEPLPAPHAAHRPRSLLGPVRREGRRRGRRHSVSTAFPPACGLPTTPASS